jgi:hypothetical protein
MTFVAEQATTLLRLLSEPTPIAIVKLLVPQLQSAPLKNPTVTLAGHDLEDSILIEWSSNGDGSEERSE